MNSKKASSGVYIINYHIVCTTKYRYGVLNANISKTLNTIINTICDTKGWEILESRVLPDYIHLRLSVTPFERPVDIIKILKGVTAKQLFALHPELKNMLWGGHLWGTSYYIDTTDPISAETIQKYIQEQQTKDGRCKSD
jgi:putative transposase